MRVGELRQPDAHYESIEAQRRYSFTGKSSSGTTSFKASIPMFEDFNVRDMKVGVVRRIFNNQFSALTRLMSKDPSPEFPQVTRIESETRAAFFRERWTGYSLREPVQRAWLDMDALGIGCVLCSPDDVGDFRVASLTHIPPGRLIYDRLALTPQESDWLAFVHIMHKGDAMERFPKAALRTQSWGQTVTQGGDASNIEVVAVIEYRDKEGFSCVFVGDHQGPVYEVNDEAVYGDGRIGAALGTGWVPPGFTRPMGRVFTQMPVAEMRARIDERMAVEASAPGIYIYNPNALSATDIKRLKESNKNHYFLPSDNPPDNMPPLMYVSGPGIDQGILTLDGKLNVDEQHSSGISDIDRGAQARRETATATAARQQASAANMGMAEMNTINFMSSVVDEYLNCAALFDDMPTVVDVRRANIKINDPENQLSSIAEIMAEPSKVVITSESLSAVDERAKKDEMLQEVYALMPLVQAGLISGPKVAEEILRIRDVPDPEAYMPTPAQGIATAQQQQVSPEGVDEQQ